MVEFVSDGIFLNFVSFVLIKDLVSSHLQFSGRNC